jgi:hypothetical protein
MLPRLITTERVRQMEAKTLRWLRHPSRSLKWGRYLQNLTYMEAAVENLEIVKF